MNDAAIRVRDATRADIPRLCEFQQNMARETEGKSLDVGRARGGYRRGVRLAP